VSQAAKRLPGSGLDGNAVVGDLLGRTVCMYTANAEAYRTAGQSISERNGGIRHESTNKCFPRRT